VKDLLRKEQGARNKGGETRNKEQGTRNKKQGTRDKKQATRNRGQATRISLVSCPLFLFFPIFIKKEA
jgi:hypothetical protein